MRTHSRRWWRSRYQIAVLYLHALQLGIARPRVGRRITINFHRTVQKPISVSHTDDEDRDTVCARLNQPTAAQNRCIAPCPLKCDQRIHVGLKSRDIKVLKVKSKIAGIAAIAAIHSGERNRSRQVLIKSNTL